MLKLNKKYQKKKNLKILEYNTPLFKNNLLFNKFSVHSEIISMHTTVHHSCHLISLMTYIVC